MKIFQRSCTEEEEPLLHVGITPWDKSPLWMKRECKLTSNIHFCFLTVDIKWPHDSCSCCHALPSRRTVLSNCKSKQICPSLSCFSWHFCHNNKRSNLHSWRWVIRTSQGKYALFLFLISVFKAWPHPYQWRWELWLIQGKHLIFVLIFWSSLVYAAYD